MMASPALIAKLRPPRVTVHHLPRPDLLARLDAGAHCKLTLVVSSVGYGKSACLAEWAQAQTNLLWYTLDATDRDPAVFIFYLLVGIRELVPDFGELSAALLHRAVPFEIDNLVLTFLGELTAAFGQNELYIVLDDFHQVGADGRIHQVLNAMLARLPQNLHFLIASREPVPLVLARLRTQGELVELDQNDLRLSPAQVALFFRDYADRLQTDPPLAQLVQQLDGWIAGLELVRHFLKRHDPVLPRIAAPLVRLEQQIYDYLAEEVWDRLPRAQQEFLLSSAILENFTAADCDEIFARHDSAAHLEYLSRRDLFITRLAAAPDVYRYHPLWTQFLVHKLTRVCDAALVNEWHKSAADYFFKRQDWDAAWRHARLAHDESLAAEILLRAFAALRMSGRLDTLERWLAQLAAHVWTKHPQLFCCQGQIQLDRGEYAQAETAFQAAIQIAQRGDHHRALLSAWSGLGILRQRRGELESSHEAWRHAIDAAEQGTPQEHMIAVIGLANLYLYCGENERAHTVLNEAATQTRAAGNSLEAVVRNNLGTALLHLGQLRPALREYQAAFAMREANGDLLGAAVCLSNIGFIRTRLGELQSARTHLTRAIELARELRNPLLLSYALSNRGDLAVVESDWNYAHELYRHSIELKENLDDRSGLVHTWTRTSELLCAQGDMENAQRCAERALELGVDTVGPNESLPAQTALALTRLRQEEFEFAAHALAQIVAAHRDTTHNQYELTRGLWYLACAQHGAGQSAVAALADALQIASEYEYQFLVVTLARENNALVALAIAENVAPNFTRQLVAAFVPQIIPVIEKLLSDSDANVRRRAVEYLARLDADEVWLPLARATRNSNHAVRTVAKQALARLVQQSPAPLFVTTLGRFQLARGQTPIPDSAWVSRKAQTLFKYLVAHNGIAVQRWVLTELLWRDQNPDKARHSLNQAVTTVRRVLEPYLPPRVSSRYLSVEGETYRLDLPIGSRVDDQAFESAIRSARRAQQLRDAETARTQYQAAADLYQGDYLVEEMYDDWFRARQEQLRAYAVEAFAFLAAAHLSNQELPLASETAQRLLAFDPLRQESTQLLMQIYLAQNQPEAAVRAYLRYEQLLHQELDLAPAPALRALYEKIRAR